MILLQRLSNLISHKRPILPAILNYQNSNTQVRVRAFTNDEQNVQQIKQLKQEYKTEQTLRFCNRTFTYRQYLFAFPDQGHGIVQELQPILPIGAWTQEQLQQLIEQQEDQVEYRKAQAQFKRTTDDLIEQAKRRYPDKIEKKDVIDASTSRTNKDKITINDIRKMSDQKFNILKKNIKTPSKPQQ